MNWIDIHLRIPLFDVIQWKIVKLILQNRQHAYGTNTDEKLPPRRKERKGLLQVFLRALCVLRGDYFQNSVGDP